MTKCLWVSQLSTPLVNSEGQSLTSVWKEDWFLYPSDPPKIKCHMYINEKVISKTYMYEKIEKIWILTIWIPCSGPLTRKVKTPEITTVRIGPIAGTQKSFGFLYFCNIIYSKAWILRIGPCYLRLYMDK